MYLFLQLNISIIYVKNFKFIINLECNIVRISPGAYFVHFAVP